MSDPIVHRIVKLLNLASEQGNGTEEERDAAAAMAAKLMAKHRVTESQLLEASSAGDATVEERHVEVLSRGRFWEIDLFAAIGSTVTVDAVYRRVGSKRSLKLVGRSESIDYVLAMHRWLAPQLAADCEAVLARDRAAGIVRTGGETISFKASFFLGACSKLGLRLKLAKAEGEAESGSSTALVRMEDAALREHYGDSPPTEADANWAADPLAALAGSLVAEKTDINPGNKLASEDRAQIGG